MWSSPNLNSCWQRAGARVSGWSYALEITRNTCSFSCSIHAKNQKQPSINWSSGAVQLCCSFVAAVYHQPTQPQLSHGAGGHSQARCHTCHSWYCRRIRLEDVAPWETPRCARAIRPGLQEPAVVETNRADNFRAEIRAILDASDECFIGPGSPRVPSWVSVGSQASCGDNCGGNQGIPTPRHHWQPSQDWPRQGAVSTSTLTV